MMSGYEVTMSSDSLTEFSVNFHGPKDSKYHVMPLLFLWQVKINCECFRSICWWSVEGASRATTKLPLQVPFYWFFQQDLPPQR
jgi:hypothetical protein